MKPDLPYKGLEPYAAEDSGRFFGRESEIDEILQKVSCNRMTLLYAASGVGKSSLLMAGVLPRLAGEGIDAIAIRSWVNDPGSAAISKLQSLLVESDKATLSEVQVKDESLPGALRHLTAFTSLPMVLVFDQLEELFLNHRDTARLHAFVEHVVEIVTDRSLDVNILFSLREDYLAQLEVFQHRIPRLFENFVRLKRMGFEQAVTAVRAPVEQLGLAYEPGVAEKIAGWALSDRGPAPYTVLSGSGGDRGVELPYLQVICERVWRKFVATRGEQTVISAAVLDELKGQAAIIREHLADRLGQLSLREKIFAKDVFARLINDSGSKIAMPESSVVSEITYDRHDRERVEAIIRSLEKERVVRIEDRAGARYVELFHDFFCDLVSAWGRELAMQADYRPLRIAMEKGRQYAFGEFKDQSRRELARDIELAVVENWLRGSPTRSEQLSTDELRVLTAFRSARRSLRRWRSAQLVAGFVVLLVAWFYYAYGRLDKQINALINEDILAARDLLEAAEDARRNASAERLELTLAAARGNLECAQLRLRAKQETSYLLWQWQTTPDCRDNTQARSAKSIRPQLSIESGGAQVWTARFEPGDDGIRSFAFSGSDGKIRIWQVSPFDSRFRVANPSAAFGPDKETLVNDFRLLGGELLLANRVNAVQVWRRDEDGSYRLACRSEEAATKTGEPVRAFSVDVDPSTGYFAAGRQNRTLQIWKMVGGGHLCDGELLPRPEVFEHGDDVFAVAFDGRGRLASASGDGMVRVFTHSPAGDSWTAIEPLTFAGHKGPVFSVDFAPAGDSENLLVSAGADGFVRVWDLDLRGPAGQFEHGGMLSKALFTGNGNTIVSTGENGLVNVWRRSDTGWVCRKRVRVSDAQVFGLDVVDAGNDELLLVTGGFDGFARTWRVKVPGDGTCGNG